MEKDVSEIKDHVIDMLSTGTSTPILSSVKTRDLQIRSTDAFRREASRHRVWLNIGSDEWLRAGRWWLMKSQSRLYDDIGSASEDSPATIPPQAYADLLKASFILVDVFPEHPQRRFWTTEYLKVEMLAEEVKHELEVIEKLKLRKPPHSQITQADLRIWSEIPPAVFLTPSLRPDAEQPRSAAWETDGEIIFWQGFGSCTTDDSTTTSEDCIILVLTSKDFKTARIVGQSQRGVDLVNVPIDYSLVVVNHPKYRIDR